MYDPKVNDDGFALRLLKTMALPFTVLFGIVGTTYALYRWATWPLRALAPLWQR